MNLAYSAEYEAFRAEVRAFLEAEWGNEPVEAGDPNSVAAALGAVVRTDEKATAFRKAAIARGYLYRSVPKRYGGSEQPADPLKAVIIAEEFRRAKAPFEIMGQGPSMLVPTLLEHGTEEQKQRFIEPTLLGRLTWCQGYSEPGAGSDLASLKTKGVLEGDHWVVTGQKIWTSNAHEADWMFALVRTEPDAPKHDGITYMLIDMKTPGIEVRPLRQMTGEADFNEVFLDNVRVPAENIVGKRGQGWQVSRSTLKHERALIGNASLIRRTFDGVLALAQLTEVRGRPAIQDPVIRDRLADLEAQVLAAEYNGMRLLTAGARGEDPGLAGLVTKLHTSTLQYHITKLAMDIMSDRALLAPGEPTAPFSAMLTTAFMWYFGLALGGGAPNIQRNVIGERGLGLPRDQRK
ncbi:MAG TPA: acyl-CoA dehydrogenase family protein [Candidatus Limnocylindria bacterium]|nr:acyl-CoA dehydrogenase family protein [Candidatus Limnocylindria bacterium]